MIDINYYRLQEEMAKNSLPSWRISKKFNLEIFEKEGFPVRINNIQQLRQIFDTMQEERFEILIRELSGLDEQELSIFIEACKESILFQEIYFSNSETILPLDTLFSQFVIFKKIKAIQPTAKSILEFGPGVGFFSFFLKHFDNLVHYSYTDSCESFYILQHHINSYIFKEQFSEKLLNKKKNQCFMGGQKVKPLTIHRKNNKTTPCNAYPWWKLAELENDGIKYDMVTSNANLLEFSEEALDDYLILMKQKLNDNGMIFIQCLGYSLLRDARYLFEKLHKNKFAVLFFTNGLVQYECPVSKQAMAKFFIVPNMILIDEKHELFDQYYGRELTTPALSNIPHIDNHFFPNTDDLNNRTTYSKEEIKKLVEDSFL